jgi:hypothetical protein
MEGNDRGRGGSINNDNDRGQMGGGRASSSGSGSSRHDVRMYNTKKKAN